MLPWGSVPDKRLSGYAHDSNTVQAAHASETTYQLGPWLLLCQVVSKLSSRASSYGSNEYCLSSRTVSQSKYLQLLFICLAHQACHPHVKTDLPVGLAQCHQVSKLSICISSTKLFNLIIQSLLNIQQRNQTHHSQGYSELSFTHRNQTLNYMS